MNTVDYKVLVKRYFLWAGGLCLCVPTIFLLLAYALDPMQFFHRATKTDSPLSTDMRAQAAGILNTFDLDSLILGTSMLENTSAAEASDKLGGKFFNISIAGGDFTERAIILKHALKKMPKNIIYSLDNHYIKLLQRADRIPAYLYDDNPFNDFRYYLSLANIKNLFLSKKALTLPDHDCPKAWSHVPDQRARFGGISHWVAHKDQPRIKDFLFQALPSAARTFASDQRRVEHDLKREEQAKEYIEKNILDIIKGHDETNFSFIFPPYSRVYYANLRRKAPKDFFLHQEIIRYLVKMTKDNPNIHIYGFEDQDFPDNIANYCDIMHYNGRFNSLFLDAIAEGKHELTPENVEAYLKKCEQKAWDYDIPALHEEVQRLLKAADAKGKA